jgi:hypothetical protein
MIDIKKTLDNLYTLVADEWELEESKKPNLNASQRLGLFVDVRQTLNDLQQKETPMKVVEIETYHFICANCEETIMIGNTRLYGNTFHTYCKRCGQKLDWSEEK